MHFADSEKEIEVKITDEGLGFRPEDTHRIFARFGKIDSGLTSMVDMPGTGLGYYIIRRILEMMNGSIRVENEGGKEVSSYLPSQRRNRHP